MNETQRETDLTVTEEQLEAMSREELVGHIATLSQTVADQAQTIENFRAVMDNSVQQRKQLAATVEDFTDRLDELERDLNLTAASVPAQSKTKVENVRAILKHAHDHANGGIGGVKVDTGEVTAAIDGSRSTARRLMDDIAGRFDWADVENPGGPTPKQLKLGIKEMSWTTVQDEIAREYGVRDA